MKTIALLLLILVLAAGTVHAVGVAPSETAIAFEPGLEKTVQMKIINNDHQALVAVIYAEGELKDAVSIEPALVEFSPEDNEKTLSYRVKLPMQLDGPGSHEAKIVVRAVPKDEEHRGAGVGASLIVISKLIVTAPMKGKYAQIGLIIPLFEKGRQSSFAVDAANIGTENIETAHVILDIYGPLQNKLRTLTSPWFSLAARDKKQIILEWVPDLENGNYNAVATLVYDELSAKAERPFTIGSMGLEIASISVDSFKLGGIAKFDIFVRNNWNLPVEEAFAETVVKDKEGTVYTRFKTATATVPAYGTQRLEAFWDTAKVMPGVFDLDITLKYLGTSANKVFEIVVEQDRITAKGIGAVTTEPGRPAIYTVVFVLAIAVIGLIVFNAYMYMKRRK